MTTFPNPVNLKLSGVDYLCLKMQSNPGQSKRYYLKQKNIYQHGSDYSSGGNGMNGYFAPGCFYDGYLWRNTALNTVKVKDWMGRVSYRPKSCQMHLTQYGWKRANIAREKLGLEPVPYIID
jgi:hypothetical protein